MKKKDNEFSIGARKILRFVAKAIYYIFLSIYLILKSSVLKIISVTKKTGEIYEKRKIDNERKKMKSEYSEFSIIRKDKGDFGRFEKNFYDSDSMIGIILGARGSGKTAFGIKMLENSHTKTEKKCYAVGFSKKEMPEWIEVVESVSEIGNDSIVLIDEGGVLFSSRKSMTSPNKMLSDLLLISRHKNISILFISQNSSNLDINVIRQADFLVLKPSSLLQKDFERKIIGKIYESLSGDFSRFQKRKGLTYIYSDKFRGFITNPLPSFWKTSISKSFR